jgi:hypothetical protein
MLLLTLWARRRMFAGRPNSKDRLALAYELVAGYVAGDAAAQASLATTADPSPCWLKS